MPGKLGVKITRGQNRVLFCISLQVYRVDLLRLIGHNRVDMTEHDTFHEHPQQPKPKKKQKLNLLSVLLLVLLFLVGTFGYLYYQTDQKLRRLSTPQGQDEVAKKEVQELTAKLGKLTILPQEEAVVATILDAQYLATQSAFYQDAQNGDKLVVYPQAQKAYIYSPEKNIIVNAGPLIVNQDQSTRPVRFEVRNGSTTAGAAARMKTQLEEKNQLVSALSDASKKDYAQTLLITVNPALQGAALDEFAQEIGATVVRDLPEGEARSEADLLIIVGSDQTAAQSSPASSPPIQPED